MSVAYYDEDYGPPPESIWQRVNRWLWALLILTVVAIVIGTFLPELQKQRVERAQQEHLQRQIAEQETILSRHQREIGWLEHNPEYLAIIARDRLNLMKPGEAILLTDQAKEPAIEPEVPANKPEAPASKPPVPAYHER